MYNMADHIVEAYRPKPWIYKTAKYLRTFIHNLFLG